MEGKDRNRTPCAGTGPAESGYGCDGRDARVEPATKEGRHTPAAGKTRGIDTREINAQSGGDVINGIADVCDIVDPCGINRHVPPAAVGLQTRYRETFAGGDFIEAAGSSLARGCSAAAM
jgi:hypothetical protein